MSRSVSAPSSVTKTSPCWNGLIVPGSTLRYGSNFCACTCRPRALSRRPSEAATMPLPRAETTPPVTKTYFVGRPTELIGRPLASERGKGEKGTPDAKRLVREADQWRGSGGTGRVPQRGPRSSRRERAEGERRSCPPQAIEPGQARRALDRGADRDPFAEECEACEGADRYPSASSRESLHGLQA